MRIALSRSARARATARATALACVLVGLEGAACASRASAPAGESPQSVQAEAAQAPPSAAVRLSSAPDQFLTAGDVRLRYREIGRGEPVVLLHGLGASLVSWRGVADSLAAGNPAYRVIVLDQRGHGASSKFADPARFGREMATDVVRLLDHLRVPRAHVVGHSMGAVVAAYVAAHHPDRVATVSISAPPAFADSATTARVMAPVIAGLEQGSGFRAFFRQFAPGMPDSAAAASSAQILASNDLGSLIAVQRAFGGVQVGRAGAAQARVPALVAVGTRDEVIAKNARELASWWPRARLLEIEGADHIGVLRRPELLAAVRAQLRARAAR